MKLTDLSSVNQTELQAYVAEYYYDKFTEQNDILDFMEICSAYAPAEEFTEKKDYLKALLVNIPSAKEFEDIIASILELGSWSKFSQKGWDEKYEKMFGIKKSSFAKFDDVDGDFGDIEFVVDMDGEKLYIFQVSDALHYIEMKNETEVDAMMVVLLCRSLEAKSIDDVNKLLQSYNVDYEFKTFPIDEELLTSISTHLMSYYQEENITSRTLTELKQDITEIENGDYSNLTLSEKDLDFVIKNLDDSWINVDMNEAKNEKVIVVGDRGKGKYEVELGNREKKLEVEDEEIHKAKITKIVKQAYNYKVGDSVYVVKGTYGVEGTWGGIDPFVGIDEAKVKVDIENNGNISLNDEVDYSDFITDIEKVKKENEKIEGIQDEVNSSVLPFFRKLVKKLSGKVEYLGGESEVSELDHYRFDIGLRIYSNNKKSIPQEVEDLIQKAIKSSDFKFYTPELKKLSKFQWYISCDLKEDIDESLSTVQFKSINESLEDQIVSFIGSSKDGITAEALEGQFPQTDSKELIKITSDLEKNNKIKVENGKILLCEEKSDELEYGFILYIPTDKNILKIEQFLNKAGIKYNEDEMMAERYFAIDLKNKEADGGDYFLRHGYTTQLNSDEDLDEIRQILETGSFKVDEERKKINEGFVWNLIKGVLFYKLAKEVLGEKGSADKAKMDKIRDKILQENPGIGMKEVRAKIAEYNKFLENLNENEGLTQAEIKQAKKEGWMLTNNPDGKYAICKDDDSDIFKDDQQASKFVRTQKGKLYKKAVNLVGKKINENSENQNKVIRIDDFNKFNTLDSKHISKNKTYKSGYNNVFNYTEELENFLRDNQVSYQIKYLDLNENLEDQDKYIQIDDFNRFNNMDSKHIKKQKAFKSGYWNVFKYSKELEDFLKDMNVNYQIKTAESYMEGFVEISEGLTPYSSGLGEYLPKNVIKLYKEKLGVTGSDKLYAVIEEEGFENQPTKDSMKEVESLVNQENMEELAGDSDLEVADLYKINLGEKEILVIMDYGDGIRNLYLNSKDYKDFKKFYKKINKENIDESKELINVKAIEKAIDDMFGVNKEDGIFLTADLTKVMEKNPNLAKFNNNFAVSGWQNVEKIKEAMEKEGWKFDKSKKTNENFEEYYTTEDLKKLLSKNGKSLTEDEEKEVNKKAEKDGGFSPDEFHSLLSEYGNKKLADKWLSADKFGTDRMKMINESKYDSFKTVKEYAANMLADFFRVDVKSLSEFNFDGKDDISKLSKVLNSTNDEGTKGYYNAAINSAKKDLNVEEGINESKAEEVAELFAEFVGAIFGASKRNNNKANYNAVKEAYYKFGGQLNDEGIYVDIDNINVDNVEEFLRLLESIPGADDPKDFTVGKMKKHMAKFLKKNIDEGLENNQVYFPTDEEDFQDEDCLYVKVEDSENSAICLIKKSDRNWKEICIFGSDPYGFGGKTYQSYLSKDDVMDWLRKDYKKVSEITSLQEFEDAKSYIESVTDDADLNESKKFGFFGNKYCQILNENVKIGNKYTFLYNGSLNDLIVLENKTEEEFIFENVSVEKASKISKLFKSNKVKIDEQNITLLWEDEEEEVVPKEKRRYIKRKSVLSDTLDKVVDKIKGYTNFTGEVNVKMTGEIPYTWTFKGDKDKLVDDLTDYLSNLGNNKAELVAYTNKMKEGLEMKFPDLSQLNETPMADFDYTEEEETSFKVGQKIVSEGIEIKILHVDGDTIIGVMTKAPNYYVAKTFREYDSKKDITRIKFIFDLDAKYDSYLKGGKKFPSLNKGETITIDNEDYIIVSKCYKPGDRKKENWTRSFSDYFSYAVTEKNPSKVFMIQINDDLEKFVEKSTYEIEKAGDEMGFFPEMKKYYEIYKKEQEEKYKKRRELADKTKGTKIDPSSFDHPENIVSIDISIEYAYRINAAYFGLTIKDKNGNDVEEAISEVISDNLSPNFAQTMYNDGKTGKQILNKFFTEKMKKFITDNGIKFTIGKEEFKEDDTYHAEGNSDS